MDTKSIVLLSLVLLTGLVIGVFGGPILTGQSTNNMPAAQLKVSPEVLLQVGSDVAVPEAAEQGDFPIDWIGQPQYMVDGRMNTDFGIRSYNQTFSEVNARTTATLLNADASRDYFLRIAWGYRGNSCPDRHHSRIEINGERFSFGNEKGAAQRAFAISHIPLPAGTTEFTVVVVACPGDEAFVKEMTVIEP